MAKIGFIGLGNMGLPMSQSLVKAGHMVRGFDLSAPAVERLAAAGGAGARSVSDACDQAEVLRLVDWAAMQEFLAAARGRPGAGRLRAVRHIAAVLDRPRHGVSQRDQQRAALVQPEHADSELVLHWLSYSPIVKIGRGSGGGKPSPKTPPFSSGAVRAAHDCLL